MAKVVSKADYNPYNLVEIIINNHTMYARPIAFDSEIVNHKKCTNAFGKLVKPSKLSTVCPDCGSGLILDVDLCDPPFRPVRCFCEYCNPGRTVLPDPFINPLDAGLVAEHSFDPLLCAPNVVVTDQTTVAERITEASGVPADELMRLLDTGSHSEGQEDDVDADDGCEEPDASEVEESEGKEQETVFDDTDLAEL